MSEEVEKIVSVLDGFSQEALDSAVNVAIALKNKGMDLEDLVSFVRGGGSILDVRQKRRHQLFWKHYDHRCKQCAHWMEFASISEPPGKSNVYGWTGHWYCENCGSEEYTKVNPKRRT